MRTGTVTSISIIAAAALGAALIGVLGAYAVLPEVAPSVTTDTSDAQAASARDSTEHVASARDSTAGQASGSGMGQADSTTQGGTTTTQDGGQGAGDQKASMGAPDDSSEAEQLQALRDSIDTLKRRLQTTQETADTLQSELADADAEQAKVNELSDALMEMRRRNLGNLLKDVEMSVLKKLYQETSGQARTRLLQSMAPAKAAQFVNQVVEEGPEAAARSESGS